MQDCAPGTCVILLPMPPNAFNNKGRKLCADVLGSLPGQEPGSLPHAAFDQTGKPASLLRVGCYWKVFASLTESPALLGRVPSPTTKHLGDLKTLLPGCFPLALSQPSHGSQSGGMCEGTWGWLRAEPRDLGRAAQRWSQDPKQTGGAPGTRPALRAAQHPPARWLRGRQRPSSAQGATAGEGAAPWWPLDLAQCPGTASHPRLPWKPRPDG